MRPNRLIDADVLVRDGQRLTLRVAGDAGCSACAAGQGCGMGLLGLRGRAATRQIALRVSPTCTARPGDRVVVAASPGVVAAALLGYGLPLGGVLLGSVGGPGWALAGCIVGAVTGSRIARHRLRWRLAAAAPAR